MGKQTKVGAKMRRYDGGKIGLNRIYFIYNQIASLVE